MSYRPTRVARLLQREVAQILQTDFGDQIPGLTTVTDVRVTKDLSIAYVNVSVLGDSAGQRQASFKQVEARADEVRKVLAGRIRHQVRKVPELRFFLDESLQQAKRMDELFDRIREERGDTPEEAPQDEDARRDDDASA
jgi:ribosome-binding factor A